MQAVYGNKCTDLSTVSWVWQFKQEQVGEESLCDKARLRRPLNAIDKPHQECVEELINIEDAEKWLCPAVIKVKVNLFIFFVALNYLPSFIFYFLEAKLCSPPT
jgi:hypothetical protein